MPTGVYKHKKPSLTTRKKMSESAKKRFFSEETKGKIKKSKIGSKNPMFGKIPTFEHRRKISESLRKSKSKNRDITRIELIFKIRNCFKYRLWRESVFKRDKYKCLWCGDRKGGNLNADHIKPFILIYNQNSIANIDDALNCEELWDTNNGRTLCKKCHKTTDTWGEKAKRYFII